MANPNVNRISSVIAAPDLTIINTSLTNFLNALLPYTQPLTQEERDSMFSLKEWLNIKFSVNTNIKLFYV